MTASSKDVSTRGGDLSSTITSSMMNNFPMQQFPSQIPPNANILNFLKMIRTYDEGLAFLHYCRLIHKTAQANRSSILSQWLLNICSWLPKMKLQGGDKSKN